MSLFNKILFWRKEHDKMEALAHQEMGKSASRQWEKLPGEKSSFDPFAAETPLPPLESPFQRESPLLQRDLELISTKLDTIKAMVSSLEQRMANVEKSFTKEQKQKLW